MFCYFSISLFGAALRRTVCSVNAPSHILHLLTGEDLPTFQSYSITLTVKYCGLSQLAHRFFKVSSVKDLFGSNDNRVINDCIKETHFYNLVQCTITVILTE